MSTTSLSKESLTFVSLPPEITLSILSQIPYDPSFLNLRLVNRSFSNLIQTYKQSLCLQILSIQYPANLLSRRFPRLRAHSNDNNPTDNDSNTNITFHLLNKLHLRLSTLTRIQRSSERLRMCCCKQSAWMRPEWLSLQHAGLHLLYLLSDTSSHTSKQGLITSLPTTSLAILLFTIHLCLHHLRAVGPRLISVPSSSSSTMAFEIDLATQELILQNGPLWLDCLLCHCPFAIKRLEDEVSGMEERQMPDESGVSKPKTLIAVARGEMAKRVEGKGWGEGMWEIVRGLGGLTEGEIDRVVGGEEVEVRKKMLS